MKATITELLYENTPDDVTQLNKIYDIDRYHARVFYLNTRGDVRSENTFKQKSLYRFEDKDGNMDLVLFTKSYGVSKTNRRYISKKVEFRVRVRESGVWVTHNSKIRAFMLYDSSLHTHHGKISDKVQEVLYNKLAWYRYVREEFPHSNRSLNYFINNNLYNKKDIIKHEYGFDWPLSNLLYELDKKGALHGASDFRNLKYYKPWITNENKFNEKLILDNWALFHDSLRVAKALDRKVSLRWSKARLEKEHINMSMDMVHIIYQYDESALDNKKCYVEFAEHSGFELISTMKDLAIEGITKRHCVVSYKGSINNHYSGIYAIEDYTLELGEGKDGLYNRQFRGVENALAPDDLHRKVDKMLISFNKEYYKLEVSEDKKEYAYDLPF